MELVLVVVLVRKVERYQVDIVGLDSVLYRSCPGWEVPGSCGGGGGGGGGESLGGDHLSIVILKVKPGGD